MTHADNLKRRSFLALAAAGTGALADSGTARAADRTADSFEPLDESDTLPMSESARRDILDNARGIGVDQEYLYGSCSRSSVAALEKALPFMPEDGTLVRAASCVDGGATPTKEASCGAFTGSGMVIGYVCGPEGRGRATVAHELMNDLHGRFVEEWGGVLCKDVRAAADGKCAGVVGSAVSWTAELLLDRFAVDG